MNSREYPNYNKLVEAHRKIRGDSSHPDYDKPTELEILMEKIKNLEITTDTIDYNCPDSNNMEEIVGNTDNIQNHIDSCDDGLKLMPRSPILYFLQRSVVNVLNFITSTLFFLNLRSL